MSTPCAVGCINEPLGGLLPSYEFNLLDDAEKDQFEKHMAQCTACASEVAGMKETWHWLRQHADLFDHPERYYEKRSAWLAALSFKPVMALAAAAMLFLAIGIGYFQQPALWRAAGGIQIEEDGGAAVRDVSKGTELLTAGKNAWQARGLTAAKEKFQAASDLDQNNYEAPYFLGLCRLQEADSGFLWTRKVDEQKLDDAIGVLSRAAALSKKDPRAQAKIRLALAKAYLLKQDRGHALAELDAVEKLRGPDAEIGAFRHQAAQLRAKL